jgi:rSAM/selenodomain-associated transferase 1
MRVAVIIPCRNEAAALRHVLAAIPRHLVHEIIVVDNGSTDGSGEIARAAGARVVAEPTPGYGRACLAGLAAMSPSVDTVAFLDGDYADDPGGLPQLLAPIEQGMAEMVIGSRTARAAPGSLTLQQRVGNRLACALMRGFFGIRYTDLGPFRVIRRQALEQLGMRDQTFGWTVEMQAKAALHRLRVVEVPVRYRPRIGRSKISGTIRGTARAGAAILWTILALQLRRCSSRGTPPEGTPPRRLLVFLKYPTPGAVKTRLAASVGARAASEVARSCTELTLARLARFRDEAALCVDPPEALERARAWIDPGWRLHPQRGMGLGERLVAAFAQAFAEGARRVIAIGTDSPWLEPDDLETAFDVLEQAPVTVGPTEDGGYYLIGLSQPAPRLFEGVPWGTSSVYTETLAQAALLGLRVQTLPLGYDLDRVEDVERFLAAARARGEDSWPLTAIAAALRAPVSP